MSGEAITPEARAAVERLLDVVDSAAISRALDLLSLARTALDDPLALEPSEIGVDGPRSYAINRIDEAMRELGADLVAS